MNWQSQLVRNNAEKVFYKPAKINEKNLLYQEEPERITKTINSSKS